jgi:nucleotide-binding universal stress UspA family protein
MSKIIVAVDFSECSINALQHAVSIAEKCARDLVLVWVQKPQTEKDKFDKPAKESVKDVENQFRELIAKYQPELPGNKITYKLRTGKVYREITAEARETNAMMVVAGTHGASGFEEFWIGSNANRIISASPCPVITIRAGIDIHRPLRKILLPIDSTLETRQKTNFTGYLAKAHNAEIYILAMYSSRIKEIKNNVDLYAEQVAAHLEEEKIKYRIEHADADNISDKMIEFAQKIDANLISIMTEQETTTSNLWMGTYAHQTVNHSPIPVLSIHSMDLLATGIGF